MALSNSLHSLRPATNSAAGRNSIQDNNQARSAPATGSNLAGNMNGIQQTDAASAASNSQHNEDLEYAEMFSDIQLAYQEKHTTRQLLNRSRLRHFNVTRQIVIPETKKEIIADINDQLSRITFRGTDLTKAGTLVQILLKKNKLMQEFYISTVGEKYRLVEKKFHDNDPKKLEEVKRIISNIKTAYESDHYRYSSNPFLGSSQFAKHPIEQIKRLEDALLMLNHIFAATKDHRNINNGSTPYHDKRSQKLRQQGRPVSEITITPVPTRARNAILKFETRLKEKCGIVRIKDVFVMQSDSHLAAPVTALSTSTTLLASISKADTTATPVIRLPELVITASSASSKSQETIATDVHARPVPAPCHNPVRAAAEQDYAYMALLHTQLQSLQSAADAIAQLPVPTRWEEVKMLFGFGPNLALRQGKRAIDALKKYDIAFKAGRGEITQYGIKHSESITKMKEKVKVFMQLSASHGEVLQAAAKHVAEPGSKWRYIGQRLTAQFLPVTVLRSLLAGITGAGVAAAITAAFSGVTAALTLSFLWPIAAAGGTVFLLFVAGQAIAQSIRSSQEHAQAVRLRQEYNTIRNGS